MERVDRFLIQAARITIKVNVISAILIAMIFAIGFMGPVGLMLSVLAIIYLWAFIKGAMLKAQSKRRIPWKK